MIDDVSSYCNMDYIVGSALKLMAAAGMLPPLVLSYDIVCQWALKFLERLRGLLEQARVELPAGPQELRYTIPKYHFRAHKEEGHTQYSLNLMPGIGRVCGFVVGLQTRGNGCLQVVN